MTKKKQKVKTDAEPAIDGLKIKLSQKAWNGLSISNFIRNWAMSSKEKPVGMIDPELRGLFASIGIEKGKKFASDDRMHKILEEAVAVGKATARAICIRARDEEAYFYKDSGWYTGFVGGNHEFLKNGGAGGRNLDARVLFHYMTTVITPAMVNKMMGVGSQYALLKVDKNGEYMDGLFLEKIANGTN